MLDQLTILAPGLLGGSVARAARARGAANRIVIWARRREAAKSIAGQPWCDAVMNSPEEAAEGASLVVVASPVDAIVPLIRRIAPRLPAGSLVTDVGSVKGRIARESHDVLGTRAHFVGAHPMAGSEKTGWEFGSATLFEGRTCFVTPLPETDAGAVGAVSRFWSGLGAIVATVDPDQHDQIVAHISHLPQLAASALCSTLAGVEPAWRRYAGGGLRDTTRIAGSDPKLWRTILEENRDEIRRALRRYQDELHAFDAALMRKDWDEITSRLARAKDYRDGFGA